MVLRCWLGLQFIYKEHCPERKDISDDSSLLLELCTGRPLRQDSNKLGLLQNLSRRTFPDPLSFKTSRCNKSTCPFSEPLIRLEVGLHSCTGTRHLRCLGRNA